MSSGDISFPHVGAFSSCFSDPNTPMVVRRDSSAAMLFCESLRQFVRDLPSIPPAPGISRKASASASATAVDKGSTMYSAAAAAVAAVAFPSVADCVTECSTTDCSRSTLTQHQETDIHENDDDDDEDGDTASSGGADGTGLWERYSDHVLAVACGVVGIDDPAVREKAIREYVSRAVQLYRLAKAFLTSVEEEGHSAVPMSHSATRHFSQNFSCENVSSEVYTSVMQSGYYPPSGVMVPSSKQWSKDIKKNRKGSIRSPRIGRVRSSGGSEYLNQYRKLALIGCGSTSTVSLFMNEKQRGLVAIKSMAAAPRRSSSHRLFRKRRSLDSLMSTMSRKGGGDSSRHGGDRLVGFPAPFTRHRSDSAVSYDQLQKQHSGSMNNNNNNNNKDDVDDHERKQKQSKPHKQKDISPVEREVRILRRLHHPNVVKLIEVIDDDDEGMTHLVLEHLPLGAIATTGEGPAAATEKDYATCEVIRPTSRLVHYMRQLIAAVTHIHSRRVVHNDIKPDNILLSADGRIVLTDFGESVLLPKSACMDKSRRDSHGVSSVTAAAAASSSSYLRWQPNKSTCSGNGSFDFTSMLAQSTADSIRSDSSMFLCVGVGPDGKLKNRAGAGTPAFSAPELIGDNMCGFSSDVWSLGVVIYGLFFGRLPFYARNTLDMFDAILNAPLVFPSLADVPGNADVSQVEYDGWVQLCKALLVRCPEERMTLAALRAHPMLQQLVAITNNTSGSIADTMMPYGDAALAAAAFSCSSTSSSQPSSSEPTTPMSQRRVPFVFKVCKEENTSPLYIDTAQTRGWETHQRVSSEGHYSNASEVQSILSSRTGSAATRAGRRAAGTTVVMVSSPNSLDGTSPSGRSRSAKSAFSQNSELTAPLEPPLAGTMVYSSSFSMGGVGGGGGTATSTTSPSIPRVSSVPEGRMSCCLDELSSPLSCSPAPVWSLAPRSQHHHHHYHHLQSPHEPPHTGSTVALTPDSQEVIIIRQSGSDSSRLMQSLEKEPSDTQCQTGQQE